MNNALNKSSAQAEQYVLGCILMSVDVFPKVRDQIRPHHFYNEKNKVIATAIWELGSKDKSIDIVTVNETIAGNKVKGDMLARIAAYLIELTHNVASTVHVLDHIVFIKEYYVKRQETKIALELIKKINSGEDIVQTINEHQKDRDEMMTDVIVTTGTSIGDINIMDDIMKAYESDELPGIPTGWDDTNELFGGWQDTDFIILAARPGMGKTSLMLCFALYAAGIGIPVGIISLEMSKKQLKARLLSMLTGISIKNIRNGNLSSSDVESLRVANDKVASFKIEIDDRSHTDSQIRASAMSMKRNEGIKMLFIDYLQLIKSSSRSQNRNNEIGDITRNLKLMAGSNYLDMPVMCLSQLSRPQKGAGIRAPQLTDLRDSGNIEQDADSVLFIHRPEYYWENEEDVVSDEIGLAWIRIAKNRHGELTNLKKRWIGRATKFTEWEENEFPQVKESSRIDLNGHDRDNDDLIPF